MRSKQGQKFTYERSFIREDVKGFIDLTHYTDRRHEEEDRDGKVIVQGLLTTTLPTTLGGEYNLLVCQMLYGLTKPAYTEDHIICQIRIDRVEEERDKIHYKLDFQCENQKDQVVLSGYLKATELKFDQEGQRRLSPFACKKLAYREELLSIDMV